MVTKPVEIQFKKTFIKKMPEMSVELLMDIIDLIMKEQIDRQMKDAMKGPYIHEH